MLKKWAVSYIDWFDHDLITHIVRAKDWSSALQMHPKIGGFDIDWKDKDLDAVKAEFFDCDAMVECVEIVDEIDEG